MKEFSDSGRLPRDTKKKIGRGGDVPTRRGDVHVTRRRPSEIAPQEGVSSPVASSDSHGDTGPVGKQHGLDYIEYVTQVTTASMIAEGLQQTLVRSGLVLPEHPTYLALGAGSARGERAFAHNLGISGEQMTVVDRGFSVSARAGLEVEGFKGNIVEEDLFRYLRKPGVPKFDILTAFGMEYVLKDREQLERLASSLPNVLNDGGIVVVFPNMVKGDVSPLWTPHGFTSLRRGVSQPDDRETVLLYRYLPKR